MTIVTELSRCSASETLRDGRKIEIRATKPEDRVSGLDEQGSVGCAYYHETELIICIIALGLDVIAFKI